MEKEIGPVRPPFNLAEEAEKGKERLIAGTKYSGVFIDISKYGMFINAYYTPLDNAEKRYASLREGVEISWEELDKMRARLPKERKKKAVADRIEEELDMEYLKTLPIVHINKKPYYIDGERRERRSVEKPYEVWRF